MKILEINTEKTWRGGERQTLYTVEGFKEKGQDVSLLCLNNSLLAAKAKQTDVPLIEARCQFSIFVHLLFNANNYDIIYVQNSKALIWVLLSTLFHAKPVVYTRRVDFVPTGFFTLWKYKQINKVIAISEAIRTILEHQGLSAIEVIPSVVKPHELNKLRAEKEIALRGLAGKKIIATTAAFVPHKDPHTMVKAIAELKKRRTDFVFLHFGDGELMEETKKHVEQLNLQEHYLIMGFQPDVEDFFSVMDVFAMSSEEEGLGSSVLDAFLYGVPVASTHAGGLKETVEGFGLLCPVKDYKALAANINQLLDDTVLCGLLTAKARKRVTEFYGVESNTTKYLEVFRKLLLR